jgi:hypothetical protein
MKSEISEKIIFVCKNITTVENPFIDYLICITRFNVNKQSIKNLACELRP